MIKISSVQEFEKIKQISKEGIEYWYARDLQKVLDYAKWENFIIVIEKAKISCENAKQDKKDHFPDVRKTIAMPKGASKEIKDFKLSRYACYLIAQNGDSRKEQIALAQTYFAVQTRKQEVIEQNLKEIKRLEARKKLTETEKKFAKTLHEREVDGQGIAEIRAVGDQTLFGGHTTNQMKEKLGIKKNKPLADFLPTVSIAAKNLASEMTIVNTEQNDLIGKKPIKKEHTINNEGVRSLLQERGITPEKLPAEEDLKKIERKHSRQIKIAKNS